MHDNHCLLHFQIWIQIIVSALVSVCVYICVYLSLWKYLYGRLWLQIRMGQYITIYMVHWNKVKHEG